VSDVNGGVIKQPQRIGDERPGLMSRIVSRALGTDIDDPLEMERLGTTALGGIGGAMLGSRVPVAPGPAGVVINPVTGAVAGGLAGAVSGSVAPEGTLELMEFAGLLPEGAREERALSDEELRRVASGEALIEVVTAGTATGIRAGGRTLGRVLTGVTKEGEELAGRAAEQGIDLAPFQVGKRRIGRGIVNVLGRFPIIGQPAQSLTAKTERQIAAIIEKMPERVAPLLRGSELGPKILKEAGQLVKTVGEGFSKQYDQLKLDALEAGIEVVPFKLREAAESVIENINRITPRDLAGDPKTAAASSEYVSRWIQDNVQDLGTQSLGQMDEILKLVDEGISEAPEEIRRAVARSLILLKTAAKSDVAENIFKRDGTKATEFADRLAKLDADFSETMAFLFETSAGKKTEIVASSGLRGTTTQAKDVTTVPVDQLANIMLNNLTSPQAIDELRRLVTPETFRAVGARVLADAFQQSVKITPEGAFLNADELANQLGKLGQKTDRAEALRVLFENSNITDEMLTTIVDAARAMSDSPIPNASAFLARRAGIAGAKGVIRGVMPWLAVGSAGAGAAALSNVFGGMMFMLGTTGLVTTVADPVNARALRSVLSQEATKIQIREGFLRLMRAGINSGVDAGEWTAEQAKNLQSATVEWADQMFPEEDKR
jgi:hypothetical protein